MADDRLRAIVLEDDADTVTFMRIALERYGGMHVDTAGTADELLAAAGPAAPVTRMVRTPGLPAEVMLGS